MKYAYSDKPSIQALISLMKAYNISKVVVSPGATHMNFVASIQQDPFFVIISETDERNAAYIACGLAAETGEAVAIACTGATASRNYLPALTEAYYRKLPVLAITGSQDINMTGNLSPQFVDRSRVPVDSVRYSVTLQSVHCRDDAWDVNLKINRALSELFRFGGGPVHINLITEYISDKLCTQTLPEARVIRRYTIGDQLPSIQSSARVAVTAGAHKRWTNELRETVDAFCEAYNAIVICDHSSGYRGKYRVFPSLLASQERHYSELFDIDLLIHIGEQSGDYYTMGHLYRAKEVWRISEDGEMRDTFRKLTCVFQMPEQVFFSVYSEGKDKTEMTYYASAQQELEEISNLLPELPLSNIWIAQILSQRIPDGSVVHLGVSNTMRSWTFFDFKHNIFAWANTGCRGIDGALPTVIGMALSDRQRLHFCILGDLTFFYALNSLGNRHITGNLRILLINNGGGAEFNLYQHTANQLLHEDVESFIAAAGHYGTETSHSVENIAKGFGFKYMSASTKEEVLQKLRVFLEPNLDNAPVLFEIKTCIFFIAFFNFYYNENLYINQGN